MLTFQRYFQHRIPIPGARPGDTIDHPGHNPPHDLRARLLHQRSLVPPHYRHRTRPLRVLSRLGLFHLGTDHVHTPNPISGTLPNNPISSLPSNNILHRCRGIHLIPHGQRRKRPRPPNRRKMSNLGKTSGIHNSDIYNIRRSTALEYPTL